MTEVEVKFEVTSFLGSPEAAAGFMDGVTVTLEVKGWTPYKDEVRDVLMRDHAIKTARGQIPEGIEVEFQSFTIKHLE